MKKGFRVVPLVSTGEIPNEVGEVHHFSHSLERAEWWAARLPNEDLAIVPSAFHYAMYGCAIVEVVVGEIHDDRFFPGIDFSGRIITVGKIVRVVRYQKRTTQSWWKRLLRNGRKI